MSLKKDSDHLKNMEIYETQRRKLEKKKIVIFWKTWRFQNHNGESYIKRRLWSFEKYGDLWNTGETVINKNIVIFWNGELGNTREKVIKKENSVPLKTWSYETLGRKLYKNPVIFWKTWRYMKHKGEG